MYNYAESCVDMSRAIEIYRSEDYSRIEQDLAGLDQYIGNHDFFKACDGVTPKHVVIKPNWVQEANEEKDEEWEAVIFSPDLLIFVVRSISSRLCARSTVTLCDAPHTYASFEKIVGRGDLRNRIEILSRDYPDITFEILDLRREIWRRDGKVVVERKENKPDPRGYVRYNLGTQSLFFGHPGEGQYYGADYDTEVVNRHHSGDIQEYLLAGTPIACDFFVNCAKLKTHKKTGLTACLKNLVGINGDKNWLPHHTRGSEDSGGDEFPGNMAVSGQLESKLKALGKRLAIRFGGIGLLAFKIMRNAGIMFLGDSNKSIRNGNWWGNNTCWRMVLDLNRCLLLGNLDGSFRPLSNKKPYLGIVDGIVGGEGSGPISPTPIESKVVIAGDCPLEVDMTCARLMGFDMGKIPLVSKGMELDLFGPGKHYVDKDTVLINDHRIGECVNLECVRMAGDRAFEPHFGWKGMIELYE